MPWNSGKEFAAKHNKKLSGSAAEKAKDVANKLIEKGLSEGTAIAVANKIGNQAQASGSGNKKKGKKS